MYSMYVRNKPKSVETEKISKYNVKQMEKWRKFIRYYCITYIYIYIIILRERQTDGKSIFYF